MFTVEDIARVCHEANKSLCEMIGDNSQVPFNESPDWQRESSIKGVQFCLENPDAPASANHESWLAEKEATGWKYGAVKNPDLKEHPCMVPYDQLPEQQRAKDHLFKSIVAGLRPFLKIS